MFISCGYLILKSLSADTKDVPMLSFIPKFNYIYCGFPLLIFIKRDPVCVFLKIAQWMYLIVISVLHLIGQM